MKKLMMLCLVTGALAACNSNSSSEKTEKTTVDVSQNPDYQKGLALVAKNKCLTCHAIDETVTGPPYREVAKKYASYPDTIVSHLAGKIISGGNGVWGEVSMIPHPDVSKEDAEAMVRYILLLKK
jgi:cytochrome c